MMNLLRDKLIEVVRSVAPIVAFACVLQVTLVHMPVVAFLHFLGGSVLLVLGLTLFLAGIELGILPIGKAVGASLPKRGSVTLILGVAFVIGFATTVAEPDVIVLAQQVDEATEGGIAGRLIHYVIAGGVAVFTALAMARVIFGFSMILVLSAGYAFILVLAFLAPADLVPLAFDSGGVTTGAVAGPAIIALAVGVSAVLAGRSAITDGFGLLGIASIGPVLAVLVLALVFW
jgi:hypothetical protein